MVELACWAGQLEHGWASQLEHGCWQVWTWLSWPAWTWLLTGLNMVELASLNMVVDRLVHGWAGQLEHGCWQAWTWLSWPAWTWLLTDLNMVVDRLEHGWAGQLEHGCWKSCSRMLEQTVHCWNIRYCSQSNLTSFKCWNSNCVLTFWRLRRRVFSVVDLKALKVWLWRLFHGCLRFHIVLIKTSLFLQHLRTHSHSNVEYQQTDAFRTITYL